MVVAVFTDRMWRDLCGAVGKPQWGEDPRFNTPQQRMVNRDTIIAALSEIFAREPISRWRTRLTPLGIPCTPVQRIDQVVEEEQVRARDMIVEVETAGSGTLRLPGVPIKFSDAAGSVRTGPPRLGEHSRQIVRELGYEDADVERLESAGVIATR
jgi:crotonobetainyl-CoA:carnitine CoA-transferase CaiB-like acyl-CoA transferase